MTYEANHHGTDRVRYQAVTHDRHGARRRRRLRPELARLEDRVLLSQLAPVTESFTTTDQPQFNGNQAVNTFLGGTFDTNNSFGSISSSVFGSYGAEVNLSLSGKAGLDLNFSADGGTVGSAYTATLDQGFDAPTNFGQTVTFDPSNTSVAIDSGNFSTTSPSFGYGASIDMGLNGTIGGEIGVGSTYGGSFSFGGNLDIPLMSVNNNDSGEVSVLGYPFLGASTGSGIDKIIDDVIGGVQNFLLSSGLYYGISREPPTRLKVNITTPAQLELEQDLQFQLGVPKQLGPYTVPRLLQGYTPNAAIDLGSVIEEAPSVALSSSSPGQDGVLTNSGDGTIAQLNLQLGALTGPLLGLGALSTLGTTDIINVGPLAIDFTPVSFQLQPTLSANQVGTVTPSSRLTYTFTNPSGQPMDVGVTLDGQYLGDVPSVTFTPGVDTVGVRFDGTPITVTPTWAFQESYSDQVTLEAGLEATPDGGRADVPCPRPRLLLVRAGLPADVQPRQHADPDAL